MQEEEDEDDIYAPDDSIPGLSTPAPNPGAGGAILSKANDELEEGEEEDEEMEEDYGDSDSVGFFFTLSFFLLLSHLFRTYYNKTTPSPSNVYIAVSMRWTDKDLNISHVSF